MPAVDNQLRFRLPRQVHAALGQRDGRRRLEGHPKGQGHPGRHAAENPAVVVRFCFDNAVFQIKRVVVLTSHQVGRVKAAAKVNALDRRDAEGRLGNTVFHPAEHWLAQPHRQSRDAAADDAADGIAPGHGRLHSGVHPRLVCFAADGENLRRDSDAPPL